MSPKLIANGLHDRGKTVLVVKGSDSGKAKRERVSLVDLAVLIDVGKVDAHAFLHAWGGNLQHPGGRVDRALNLGDTRNGLKVGHQVTRLSTKRASIDSAATPLRQPSLNQTSDSRAIASSNALYCKVRAADDFN